MRDAFNGSTLPTLINTRNRSVTLNSEGPTASQDQKGK